MGSLEVSPKWRSIFDHKMSSKPYKLKYSIRVIAAILMLALGAFAVMLVSTQPSAVAKVNQGASALQIKKAIAAHERANRNAFVQRLRKLDRPSRIKVAPSGLLVINDQLTVSWRKLRTLSTGELKNSLQITRQLHRVRSNTNRLTPRQYGMYIKLTQSRLRTKTHYLHGSRFIKKLNIGNHPLFNKQLSEWERSRLFDIAVEPFPVASANASFSYQLKQKFAQYALHRKPHSISDFVAHFQFARAHFTTRVQALGNISAALSELQSPAFEVSADRAYRQTLRQVKSSYTAKQKVRFQAGGNNSQQSVIKRLKAMKLPFTDVNTLVYHAYKHHGEMAPNRQARPGKSKVDAYLKSAWEVLRSKSSTCSASVKQDGKAINLVFQNKVRHGNKTYHPTVFVLIGESGDVRIATFIPNMAPK
jgi:hypothetical protein